MNYFEDYFGKEELAIYKELLKEDHRLSRDVYHCDMQLWHSEISDCDLPNNQAGFYLWKTAKARNVELPTGEWTMKKVVDNKS